MKKIIIADASKASLVMTSEVFKDHFPGVQVVVARTSAECLELAKNTPDVDAFIVDFDLPDKDGAWTSARIKKHCNIPVLITAFDRPEVYQAIEDDLAPYDDCQNWLRKPVKVETVVAVAQRFCEGKYRTHRRLECQVPAVAEVMVKITTKKTVPVKVQAAASKTTAASKTAAAPKKGGKAVSAASSKSAAAQKGSSKATAAKGSASAKGGKAAPPPKMETITETVTQKMIVRAKLLDSSIGGVRVELDIPLSAEKNFEAGEVLSLFAPPAELLECGDKTLWEAWQEIRLHSMNPNKSATGKLTPAMNTRSPSAASSAKTPVAAAKGKAPAAKTPAKTSATSKTQTNIAVDAKRTVANAKTPAAPSLAKGGKQSTLSTLAQATLQVSAQTATAQTPPSNAWKTSTGLQVKGQICWVDLKETKTQRRVQLGIRVESTNNARKVFDAVLANFDHGLTPRPKEAQMPTLNVTMSFKMPQRGGTYHNQGKI